MKRKKTPEFYHRLDGRLEWICDHGVGHTVSVPKGKEKSEAWWMHGCDSVECCRRAKLEYERMKK